MVTMLYTEHSVLGGSNASKVESSTSKTRNVLVKRKKLTIEKLDTLLTQTRDELAKVL